MRSNSALKRRAKTASGRRASACLPYIRATASKAIASSGVSSRSSTTRARIAPLHVRVAGDRYPSTSKSSSPERPQPLQPPSPRRLKPRSPLSREPHRACSPQPEQTRDRVQEAGQPRNHWALWALPPPRIKSQRAAKKFENRLGAVQRWPKRWTGRIVDGTVRVHLKFLAERPLNESEVKALVDIATVKVPAMRREADWRRQLARAFLYMSEQSPGPGSYSPNTSGGRGKGQTSCASARAASSPTRRW